MTLLLLLTNHQRVEPLYPSDTLYPSDVLYPGGRLVDVDPAAFLRGCEMLARSLIEGAIAFAGTFEFLATEGWRHILANLMALAVAIMAFGVRFERRMRERE